MTTMTVTTLRILFRNYQQLWSLYESEGIDEFDTPDGPVSLWDLEYLYREGVPKLARTRRQAIEIFLVRGLSEPETAAIMGVGHNTPTGVFATKGLQRLISMMESGQLPRWRLNKAA